MKRTIWATLVLTIALVICCALSIEYRSDIGLIVCIILSGILMVIWICIAANVQDMEDHIIQMYDKEYGDEQRDILAHRPDIPEYLNN